MSLSSLNPQIAPLLEKIWGYRSLRFPQGEVIDCLLKGQDALVVIPTGGGKSLCFQLPALTQTGLTLVVSPLIALMENQVQELQAHGLPAACLHNELPRNQRRQTLQRLQQGQLRLLYLSPETLLSPPLWELLCQPRLQLQGLMLDEAHCLVQWGDSFRPAYRRLGCLRQALQAYNPSAKTMAIAAFTATADPATQAAIVTGLQLRNPQHFCLDPYRPHLSLKVQIVWTPRCRREQVAQFLKQQQGSGGLVYVRTRRDAMALADQLNTQGHRTAAYHGGLGASQRRQLEAQWLTGDCPFVVCTNAFGLGVNKKNLRWILHYHPPLLLAEYLQEIGRAGRDLKPATCLTLVSEPTGWLDSGDRQRQAFFLQQQVKLQQQAQALLPKIPPTGDLPSLKAQFPEVELSLALLHRQNRLAWLDPFHYRLLPNQGNPENLKASLGREYQRMQHFLLTRDCRWHYLLQAFSSNPDPTLRCGHCDNCLRAAHR
ncbi:RecQ family ATP-dependent DNA helicase [Synechocystis sp. LKSZ1]|uniref:RecQ family ATP-dependent DNA helicase n=1 Tax=Synechocystis sp. LKSZ1 TaxID=3144951 RepID=UPI00336BAF63